MSLEANILFHMVYSFYIVKKNSTKTTEYNIFDSNTQISKIKTEKKCCVYEHYSRGTNIKKLDSF